MHNFGLVKITFCVCSLVLDTKKVWKTYVLTRGEGETKIRFSFSLTRCFFYLFSPSFLTTRRLFYYCENHSLLGHENHLDPQERKDDVILYKSTLLKCHFISGTLPDLILEN